MSIVVETSEENATLAVARFTAEMAWAEADPEVPVFSLLSSFIQSRTVFAVSVCGSEISLLFLAFSFFLFLIFSWRRLEWLVSAMRLKALCRKGDGRI